DLSHPTLQWHASLKGVTAQLWSAAITYNWGYPRPLVAEKDGRRARLTSALEADMFIHSLGLSAPATAANSTRTAHQWDVANVTVFQLAGSLAPG
ncbi:Hypothetical predicted protein, partial [Pelobates cultripes]